MPYYRIVIWNRQKEKPVQGIRWIENQNIDAVLNIMRMKAREAYGMNLKDVEVQMLPKGCTAVLEYKEEQKKKKEAKKWQQSGSSTNASKPLPNISRKEWYKQNGTNWGEQFQKD
jgi:hypothetical protein